MAEDEYEPQVAAAMRAIGERLGARPGHMFGHPALYADRRLAVCAFGAGLGVKLSAERVSELIATGRGAPFRPHGKPPMREWVHVPASADVGDDMTTLIAEALEFAGDHAPSKNIAPAGPRRRDRPSR